MPQRPHEPLDAPWRERAVLADGTRVELRRLTPADATLLREGFQHLSPRSRVLRFLQDKPALSEAELRYLTDVDGQTHFALGAVTRGPDGRERGLGTARFVRLAERPDTAEAAVTVIDASQGLGLGKLLLAHLAEAARARGVRRFSCWVMPGNVPMQRLLESLGPTEAESDGEALHYTLPVPAAPHAPSEPLRRLLGLAAGGALTLLARHLPLPLGEGRGEGAKPRAP